MVELRILGSVRLGSSPGRDAEVLLRQAKRTALLAYLAAAVPRGLHRRDTLLALFWPESDTARARAALNQALYVLRTALGDDAITSRGDGEVGLNGEVVWCDVPAFEAALDARQPADALALYRGDMLEGFLVAGAPEFERWVERERGRLRERASEGAWALAQERAAAGDGVEAGRWARRAADLSPTDEAVARRLVTFLHHIGDRAAALRTYEDFVSRLATELELEPSAKTRALAEAIRQDEPPPPEGAFAQASARSSGRSSGPPAPPSSLGRRSALMAALLIGTLVSGGWFLLRGRRAANNLELAATAKRLAVLPFANLGPLEQEYFTDGITEEIAARLAEINRLRIIGRTSGAFYKHTDKSLSEIGKELGVGYVLEGSVRWEKAPHGPPHVRVTPRLVSTADGTLMWAEVYDEPLDGIFRVQSDIARKVVRALDVALLDPQRRVLEAAPTADLAAYDHYLRGNDYMSRPLTERFTRAAAQMYERAIELDPRFALAYARLSRVDSRMYWLYYDRSGSRLTQARKAAEKALELEPHLPQAHQSLAAYYWLGYLDYPKALRELAIAEAGAPNEVNVFSARAVLRSRQGDFPAAFADFEKARQLDPVSPFLAFNYGETRDFARDFARAESLYDHAIDLSPDWAYPYFLKAGLYLRWTGNTQQAQAALEEARTARATDDELLLLARVWVDLFDRRYWDAISQLASGGPEVVADQFRFVPRAQLCAQVYGLLGRHDLERAYYDSARTLVEAKARAQPDDPRLHSALGIAYAGLGRKAEAIEEGRKAVELLPPSREAFRGYYRVWDLARIYVMVGDYDASVAQIAFLLSIPGHLTAAWLRLDPTWDPLRGHPRFQRLAGRAQ